MHSVQLRIRDAQPGDFESLWRIDQQCFAEGISYSREELTHYMGRRGAFTLIAEALKKSEPAACIVGFAVGQRHARGLGHVITIDVVASARRSGVGSRLMDAAEERLRAAGCTSVYLETAVDNQPALKFYKGRGYFVVKTIPRYYQGKLDALLLGKDLSAG